MPVSHFTPASGSVKGSIVFVPGMWCKANVWNQWAKLASVYGWQNWTIELEPKMKNTSIHDYINQVKILLKNLKDDSLESQSVTPFIIGHSMGGLIAQKIASEIELPGVVLLNSVAPKGISNLHIPMLSRMWRYYIGMFKIFRPTNKDLAWLIFNDFNKEEIVKMSQLIADSGKVAREILFGAINVSELKCETLIVASKKDRLVPLSIQRKLVKKYGPLCDYMEVNYGHMPMLKNNSQFVLMDILAWLNKKNEEL